MHPDQLAALAAVVDEGSFEAAARELLITPSAVSQRVKALERAWGRVLVVRSTPCRPTEAGEVLLRHARHVAELEADVRASLEPGEDVGRRRLPIVVNSDSLATWFVEVLDEAATWEDCTLELIVELEDHGAQHLRSGQAVGAVTSDPAPVPGCTLEPLGVMRYLPVAAPELLARHRVRRASDIDWARLPVMQFSANDDVQNAALRRRGVTQAEVEHFVPSSQAFVAATKSGLGWAMVPELQLGDALETGELVRLDRLGRQGGRSTGGTGSTGGAGGAEDGDTTREHLDVHLTWQSWRLGSERAARLGRAVHHAAKRSLRQSD